MSKSDGNKKKDSATLLNLFFNMNESIHKEPITIRLLAFYHPNMKLRINTALSTSNVGLRSCHFLTHNFMAT